MKKKDDVSKSTSPKPPPTEIQQSSRVSYTTLTEIQQPSRVSYTTLTEIQQPSRVSYRTLTEIIEKIIHRAGEKPRTMISVQLL